MNAISFAFFVACCCTIGWLIGMVSGKLIVYLNKQSKKGRYGLYTYYQPNTVRNTSDCSIRAISKIWECSWDDALDLIVKYAKKYKDQTNCSTNLNTILYEELGMHVYLPARRMTFEKFAKLHPVGVYALNSEEHICACVNGQLYDSWDSSKNKIEFYCTEPKYANQSDTDITFNDASSGSKCINRINYEE